MAAAAAGAKLSAPVPARVLEARELLVRRLNKGINVWAGRDDLLLDCEWDPARCVAPAWFTPATGQVTVNAVLALCGADPADVNPLTREGRLSHPVLIGLCCHEASHAHSTRWPDRHPFGEGVSEAVAAAATLLEEPRIEGRQIARRPSDRVYLRAQSLLLDLGPVSDDPSVGESRWRAAKLAVMILARVDAGVLDPDDAAPVVPALTEALGSDLLEALRVVWQDAIVLEDGDVEGLVGAARRWVDLLGPEPGDSTPGSGCSMADASAAASGGDGDVPGAPAGGGDGDELAELLAAVAAAVAADAADEAAVMLAADDDGGGVDGEAEAEAADRSEKAATAEKVRIEAHKIFHGFSPSYGGSPLEGVRVASSEERRLARQLGAALRKAQFRERSKTVVDSDVPPGRLSGRQAMTAAAQRSLGQPVTAMPFRSTVRKHSPEPPLKCGIAVDVSGSMFWATAILATMAWVVAHAATYVHGQSAAVCFGDTVTPVTRPGPAPEKVTTFSAHAGSEQFSKAVRALDGILGLAAAGRGVRLLFVVSDGELVIPGEQERAQREVTRLTRAGCHIFWLTFDGYHATIPEGAIEVHVDDLADIPAAMGRALTAALRNG